MTRTHLIVAVVALGVAACGKSNTPSSAAPADGGGTDVADASDADSDADAADAEDGTDDLAPDPDSADDWDPEASPGYVDAGSGPVSPPEDPRADLTEPKEMASVTIEIKGDGGKVRKNAPQYLNWQELTRIPVDFAGQIHEFDVEVSKKGSGVGVVMSYTVGSEQVLRDYAFDTKAKFREVLRIDNGTALAITITPQTLKPYSKKEREKLEGGAENDPLAGARQ